MNVTINPVVVGNVPPTVTVSAPATATVGDTVALTATAADSDGTVSSVEFFDGATSLGVDTTAPYSFDWTGGTEGAHVITAKAVDNEGAETTSTGVNVTINPVTPPPGGGALVRQANEAQLFGLFTLAADQSSVGVAEGSGSQYFLGSTASANRAEFSFTVSTPGIYNIEGLVQSPNSGSDSFFMRVNGLPAGGYTWDTGANADFTPVLMVNRGDSGPLALDLSAGEYVVTIYQREDGTRLSQLKLNLVTPSVTPP